MNTNSIHTKAADQLPTEKAFQWVNDDVFELHSLLGFEDTRYKKLKEQVCKKIAELFIFYTISLELINLFFRDVSINPYMWLAILNVGFGLGAYAMKYKIEYLEPMVELHKKLDCVQYSFFGSKREEFLEIKAFCSKNEKLKHLSENQLIRLLNIKNPALYIEMLKDMKFTLSIFWGLSNTIAMGLIMFIVFDYYLFGITLFLIGLACGNVAMSESMKRLDEVFEGLVGRSIGGHRLGDYSILEEECEKLAWKEWHSTNLLLVNDGENIYE